MALLSSLPGVPLDAQVRDRIVAEADGNPLALLEWHRPSRRRQQRVGHGSPVTGRCRGVSRRAFAAGWPGCL